MAAAKKSKWMLSLIALSSMIGTFSGILIVQRELNLTFVMWYMVIVAVIVALNALYVLFKRKRNGNIGTGNHSVK